MFKNNLYNYAFALAGRIAADNLLMAMPWAMCFLPLRGA